MQTTSRINTSDELYDLALANNIVVTPYSLSATASASVKLGDIYVIGINGHAYDTTASEKTHLAHELGHCMTDSFYDVYSAKRLRGKCERSADRWAVLHILPFYDMQEAIRAGYTEVWELADYFNVEEDFIRKAEFYYINTLGLSYNERTEADSR